MATQFQNLLELIETLWNVNERAGSVGNSGKGELIETLWNVNDKEGQGQK